ncbi:MAG: cation diffusion facilitator family transporter [Bacteroidota bacterium]|nr:cation diffusion facilitator family transporter [Candidatus Kapabacteria bacterium]MCX7937671.1 cation diffusion facilitator family transporter [Chlorobiota bacterium]MDW8075805.1 cation diffusion facilitator family transporter [Bacteroidota bacterium]MDW8272248.1 cation diffusion facilitator family transporter [Bacteroidota bacterium]
MHSHHFHYQRDLRSLAIAIGATSTIAGVQLIGSMLSGSLALLSDSAHMLIDVSSLAIAYISLRVARRRTEHNKFTFGWRRIEILAALANGLALLGICLLLAIEAIERLGLPRIIYTTPMLITATIGLVANGIAWFVLRNATHLTTRSAYLHVLNDLLSSIVVIVGGIVISATHWHLLDPILSLVITLFIARGGIGIIRRALVILMESAPEHISVEHVRTSLCQHPSVRDVHDLHLWQVGGTSPILMAHVVVQPSTDRDQLLRDLRATLQSQYGIDHATLQLESESYTLRERCRGCEHED